MNLPDSIKKLSIYEFMIASLSILAIFNIISTKSLSAILQITVAIFVATALDFAINYIFYKKIFLPKIAIISGLFVGTILSPGSDLVFVAAASVLAITSKHIIKLQSGHIFNPASFGIFFATILGASQAWWTAQPLALVLILGTIIAWKFRRFDSQPSFLAVYFLISAAILLLAGDFSKIILKLTDPFIYFFTFFMLVEPRTSPLARNGRIVYGAIVAVLANIFLYSYPAQFVLSALLVGNVLRFSLQKLVKY